MADYVLRGTKSLLNYAYNTLQIPVPRERLAAAIGIPTQHLAGSGQDGSSYISPKYTEAQAQALADLLGTTVANVTTNGGQEIVG